MRILLLSFFSLLLLFGQAFSQVQEKAWLSDLHFQLEDKVECEPAYYMWVREEELGTSTFQEARVQCVDGRQFDASRNSNDDDFFIRKCDIEVC